MENSIYYSLNLELPIKDSKLLIIVRGDTVQELHDLLVHMKRFFNTEGLLPGLPPFEVFLKENNIQYKVLVKGSILSASYHVIKFGNWLYKLIYKLNGPIVYQEKYKVGEYKSNE